jgi:hypothetical protein
MRPRRGVLRFPVIIVGGGPIGIGSEAARGAVEGGGDHKRARPRTLKLHPTLIRPDQPVAWRGDSLSDNFDPLISRVTGW